MKTGNFSEDGDTIRLQLFASLFNLHDDGKRRRRIDLLSESIVSMIGCLGSQGIGGYVSLWARTLIGADPTLSTVVLALCLLCRTQNAYCASDGVTVNFWGVLAFLPSFALSPPSETHKYMAKKAASPLSSDGRHSFDLQARNLRSDDDDHSSNGPATL